MIDRLVRAELRKVQSTRLWWALLIPVGGLAIIINVFGGLFTELNTALTGDEQLPIVLVSLAFSLSLTNVFAMVHGGATSAAEFRHRTVTPTYLTAGGRGGVLGAKAVGSGAVGALYALVTVLIGVCAGLLGQGSVQLPEVEALLALTAIGCMVAALWGVIGAALGTLVTNQVVVLTGALVYVLVGDGVLSAVLQGGRSQAVAGLAALLPVNASEVALHTIPADRVTGGRGTAFVAAMTGVDAPLSWWASFAVLAVWTATVVVAAWLVADRRDIT